jgi:hypothetical protein
MPRKAKREFDEESKIQNLGICYQISDEAVHLCKEIDLIGWQCQGSQQVWERREIDQPSTKFHEIGFVSQRSRRISPGFDLVVLVSHGNHISDH